MVPFSFQGHDLQFVDVPQDAHAQSAMLRPRGAALYWAAERALLVADLHLEKGSFYAKDGQMLPPYDSRETLERLAQAVSITGARRVFALGDNFHDSSGPLRLDPYAAGMLSALTHALDWVWVTGNHDPDINAQMDTAGIGRIGGTFLDELEVAGIILRHEAKLGTNLPELSGHFHPRLEVKARGRRIVRPCAVRSDMRLILPAYGALTGGMNAGDPAIVSAMQPAREIDALISAKGQILRYPLWRSAA